MILLGEKKQKVHLYGLELLLLALKSDSVRGEQLGQERQLLALIFSLWVGKDVTNTLSHAPLQDLEHFFKYHTIQNNVLNLPLCSKAQSRKK